MFLRRSVYFTSSRVAEEAAGFGGRIAAWYRVQPGHQLTYVTADAYRGSLSVISTWYCKCWSDRADSNLIALALRSRLMWLAEGRVDEEATSDVSVYTGRAYESELDCELSSPFAE